MSCLYRGPSELGHRGTDTVGLYCLIANRAKSPPCFSFSIYNERFPLPAYPEPLINIRKPENTQWNCFFFLFKCQKGKDIHSLKHNFELKNMPTVPSVHTSGVQCVSAPAVCRECMFIQFFSLEKIKMQRNANYERYK